MRVYYKCANSKYGNGGDTMNAFYPVLVGEIARRGIKKTTIAESIGICDKALRNKLSGKTSFSLPEAQKIKDHFFPDISLERLFYPNIG